MRHLRLVGTIPRGTEALDHAGSWTPWRRVCTRLAQEYPANVARYGGVATSLGRTYGYRWPHGLRRWISKKQRTVENSNQFRVVTREHVFSCISKRTHLSVCRMVPSRTWDTITYLKTCSVMSSAGTTTHGRGQSRPYPLCDVTTHVTSRDVITHNSPQHPQLSWFWTNTENNENFYDKDHSAMIFFLTFSTKFIVFKCILVIRPASCISMIVF